MQPGYLVQGPNSLYAFVLVTDEGLLHGPWSDMVKNWVDIGYLLYYDPDKQCLLNCKHSYDHVNDPASYATTIITHFTDVSYVFEDYPELFI